jgi:flagellin
MAIVINTNVQALQNANNLNSNATMLTKSLARLSSGSKIVAPSDDAAGLAVSSRLHSQIARLDAALSNVINAVSFTQTQDGFMKTVDKALRRMGELSMLAQDETKSESDRALYNQEFTQLQDYIQATALQKFNDVTLFSANTLPVTIDSSGNTFGLAGVDLESASYAAATDSAINIASMIFAQ